jgi:hypothetical protein
VINVAAYACVIGNPAMGTDHRPGVQDDVGCVVDFLTERGVAITNKDQTVGLSGPEMRRRVAELVAAAKGHGGKECAAIFYFCGHAWETRESKDIWLRGQEASGGDAADRCLGLMELLKSLADMHPVLKVVVVDACRVADDGDAESGFWEAFEEVHARFLRSIPDLYIVTATGSGRRAYQGEFTKAFLERLREAGGSEGERALPLEGWLRNALGQIADERGFIQRPSFFCYTRTREWIMADLMRGKKEKRMTTAESLDEAQKALTRRLEEVWSSVNGVQFIMHAIYHEGWQAIQHTEFKAIEMEGSKERHLIADEEVRSLICNVLAKEGVREFEIAKKEKRVQEEVGQCFCEEIPGSLGTLVQWRWRVEPVKYFVFLGGGVGGEGKRQKWVNHSRDLLSPSTAGGLVAALTDYADAFGEHNSGT